MEKSTILVNGTLYDAVTGIPVGKPPKNQASTTKKRQPAKVSHQVHRRTERSKTANRKAKPEPLIQKRSSVKRTVAPSSTKSHQITKFAPRSKPEVTRQTRPIDDIRPATSHPVAKRTEARLEQASPVHKGGAIKPSSIIKNEAIDQALKKAPSHHQTKPLKHPKRMPRLISFATLALSLLLLTGYLTYINLPNLSVRVAANQAGINAQYPGYHPDGYRLAGVNYDKGSVSLKFAANAGPHKYTITQQQTSWDSTAVRENYVKTNWGDDVVPYSERGLTIYAHEGNAAWVNGGILYTITGDATLSASQVRSIATSL